MFDPLYTKCEKGWVRGGARVVPGGHYPPKFCLAPPVTPKIFRVTSCHWSRSLAESPTQTIDSSPCCKTGPSSGPQMKMSGSDLGLGICENEGTTDYHHGSALNLRNTFRHS